MHYKVTGIVNCQWGQDQVMLLSSLVNASTADQFHGCDTITAAYTLIKSVLHSKMIQQPRSADK